MTILDQSIQRKLTTMKYVVSFAPIVVSILCFFGWILFKNHLINMMQLKEFSTDLHTSSGGSLTDRSVLVDRKISFFKSYKTMKKTVPLKDHSDFKLLKDNLSFRNMIKPIEDLQVPTKTSFGYVAVLTKFYDNFRNLWNEMNFDRNALIFSFGINANNLQQQQYYRLYKTIFQNNEDVSTLDVENLYSCIYFIQMYLNYFS